MTKCVACTVFPLRAVKVRLWSIFYAPKKRKTGHFSPKRVRNQYIRVHTSRVTNFAFDTYPRKTHFKRRTAQKLARTTFRVVTNCARGGEGWIKSSSSLASEASALAFGQPARFARGLDNVTFACGLPKISSALTGFGHNMTFPCKGIPLIKTLSVFRFYGSVLTQKLALRSYISLH